MKIAILTLPLYTNYGGILQCYALQTVLERMGHDVVVLFKPKYKLFYYLIWGGAICKRAFKRYVLGIDIDIIRAPHQIIRQNTDVFINRYIHKYIRRFWGKRMANQFDAIVVGSDQIWRLECFSPIEDAFLNFAKHSSVRKLSYAASFGIDECKYSSKQLEQCKSLLQKFDKVSVREISGIDICRKFFNVDAVHMIDPTLLLTVDDYCSLIKNEKTYSFKGDMLVYMLDRTREKEELVKQISKEKGLIPFWMDSDIDDESISLSKRIKMPVEQWIRGFYEAKFVLTDSFHGCVFSILFKKPFIAIGNKERGLTRFISLLRILGLEHRLIFLENGSSSNLQSSIDWNAVDEKLNKKREEAFQFLTTI